MSYQNYQKGAQTGMPDWRKPGAGLGFNEWQKKQARQFQPAGQNEVRRKRSSYRTEEDSDWTVDDDGLCPDESTSLTDSVRGFVLFISKAFRWLSFLIVPLVLFMGVASIARFLFASTAFDAIPIWFNISGIVIPLVITFLCRKFIRIAAILGLAGIAADGYWQFGFLVS